MDSRGIHFIEVSTTMMCLIWWIEISDQNWIKNVLLSYFPFHQKIWHTRTIRNQRAFRTIICACIDNCFSSDAFKVFIGHSPVAWGIDSLAFVVDDGCFETRGKISVRCLWTAWIRKGVLLDSIGGNGVDHARDKNRWLPFFCFCTMYSLTPSNSYHFQILSIRFHLLFRRLLQTRHLRLYRASWRIETTRMSNALHWIWTCA